MIRLCPSQPSYTVAERRSSFPYPASVLLLLMLRRTAPQLRNRRLDCRCQQSVQNTYVMSAFGCVMGTPGLLCVRRF